MTQRPLLKRVKLTSRMNLFLDYTIPQTPFWDICCDHGLVGLGMMVLKKTSSHVHFVDCVPHIMDKLEYKIANLFHAPTIPFTLHLSKGQDLKENVDGVVLIAGVGGLTIKNILSSLQGLGFLQAKRLILSPHTDINVLENFFSGTQFSKQYFLNAKLNVVVGKKEKPLYIFDLKE